MPKEASKASTSKQSGFIARVSSKQSHISQKSKTSQSHVSQKSKTSHFGITSKSRKLKEHKVKITNASKFLNLLSDLTDDKSAELQVKINAYLIEECGADTVFQIIVHTNKMEAYIEAVGRTILRRKTKIMITQEFLNTFKLDEEQSYLLSDFNDEIKSAIPQHIYQDSLNKRVALYPVPAKPFSVIFCIVAPKKEHISTTVVECTKVSWPILKRTIALEHERVVRQKCQQLLRIARMLFSQVESMQTLLEIMMNQTKWLTQAEYCVVKLIDSDKMMLYDPIHCIQDPGQESHKRHLFPIDIGITGEVIRTGAMINCTESKNHPLFDEFVDSMPGVACRNLLCFPIRDKNATIGVCHLINKIGDPYFDSSDEELALACSIYCGVTIMHSLAYKKVEEANVRNGLVNDQIMYHIKVSENEVQAMLNCNGSHYYPHINNLHYTCRALPLKELPCCALKMFVALGFDTRYKINHTKLCRFILYVKKEYRDVPYHNWQHAFRVMQFAFASITNFKLVSLGYYTELQALMFMIAAILHDVDHRGTTNSYQIQGRTTLAALYSSEGSVLERHHFTQALSILNTEGCDILSSLSRKEYEKAITMLQEYIIGTDLANYFKNLNAFKLIAQDFNKENKTHITALHCIMMNSADLSDQVKDWKALKMSSLAILTEFFQQGDMEKKHGETPHFMMDRERCFIPDLQIQFLQEVCLPLFSLLGQIFPVKAEAFTLILEHHIERWEAAKPIFAAVPLTDGLSVMLSPQLDDLIAENMKSKTG